MEQEYSNEWWEPSEEEKNEDGSVKEEYFERVLPSGYRFAPTDEELMQYLFEKLNRQNFRIHKIHEEDVYHNSPQELLGKYRLYREKECYFFCPRYRKYPNGKRPSRSAKSGFWKLSGASIEIEHGGKVIGNKSTLDYKLGRGKNGNDTEWKMHEFVLKEGDIPPQGKKGKHKITDWVFCKIYKTKYKKKSMSSAEVEQHILNNNGLPRKESEAVTITTAQSGEYGSHDIKMDEDEDFMNYCSQLDDLVDISSWS